MKDKICQLSNYEALGSGLSDRNDADVSNRERGIALNSVAEQTGLSPRECSVLEVIAQGLKNDEIATALQISNNTVKTHVRNILRKLEVGNRVQAALLVRENLEENLE